LPPAVGRDYHPANSSLIRLREATMTDVSADKLFQDLQAVVRDAEALLTATAGQANDKLQEVRSRAEETVKQARSSIDSMEDSAMRRAKDLADQAEGYVRENPWQAVGVAAGIGLLVGVLLSRRS
jgi:ElaB/YqjD/DUF883 family membrane-anchored ribosome-binding protein